ncbi:hypothetical protein [Desulfohalovibrio reitneri]|jgi:hypothetical protein|nr:hypothetical protein [Desulfohalovibrio reitneri]
MDNNGREVKEPDAPRRRVYNPRSPGTLFLVVLVVVVAALVLLALRG